MTLGEKIKQARLEAGLSQRQLCGEEVTRNMLSQIENGTARPSMGTLTYFAARLGKSISYFLEEDAIRSPNLHVMDRGRKAVLAGSGTDALEILKDFRQPDETFSLEHQLLCRIATMQAAKTALEKGQTGYSAQLLEELDGINTGYCAAQLTRQYLLLLAKARPQQRSEICRRLPSLDEELLLRARAALDEGSFDRCEHLLEAAEDREGAEWNFLRAELHLALLQYGDAAKCYHKAELRFPEKCAPRLERCYRELGDFKQAYLYACKQRI